MAEKQPGLGTLSLHGGQEPDPTTNARAVPIYQTTSYVFNDTDHAANLFALKEFGNIYSRIMNPTVDVFEKRMAALEGGVGALGVASGSAAINLACLNICRSGDHIVSSKTLYGGTYNLFAHTFKDLGIEVTFVDASDPKNMANAVKENTKMFFIESIGNPANDIIDFKAVADAAHAAGVPLIVDNTVTSPILFRPFEHGADVVVHSATKVIGGHGTSIGGVIVDAGTFDWGNGKFPGLSEPNDSYHGLKMHETFSSLGMGNISYILKARVTLLRDTGPAMSPFNAFMFLQGLETMHLRVARHCENSIKLATWLEGQDAVESVNYPGLASHKDHARAKQYMPDGQGAIMTFRLKAGYDACVKLINNVKLCSHLANILDAKTLIIHPSSTTHQQLNEAEQKDAGVEPNMIRISCGLEDIEDIIADLEQAISVATS